MKFLLILIFALAMVWLWRHNRIAAARAEALERQRQAEALKQQIKPPLHPPMEQVNIVACAYCQVHIPQPDALPGHKGSGQAGKWYCSAAHRQADEAKKP